MNQPWSLFLSFPYQLPNNPQVSDTMQKFSRKSNFGKHEPAQNLTKEKRSHYLKRKIRTSNINQGERNMRLEEDKNAPKFQSFAKNIGNLSKFIYILIGFLFSHSTTYSNTFLYIDDFQVKHLIQKGIFYMTPTFKFNNHRVFPILKS